MRTRIRVNEIFVTFNKTNYNDIKIYNICKKSLILKLKVIGYYFKL